jgi:two-component system chemotaxis sensor kinase CheA
MNGIQEKYRETYINDMREHLRNLNKFVVNFESQSENTDLFNTIFRTVHTIKGNSSILQYFEIADLAHAMENLLEKIRKKEITLDQQIMDIMFESIDSIESMINAIAGSSEIVDQKEIIKKFDQILGTAVPMAIPDDDLALFDNKIFPGLSEDKIKRLEQAVSEGKNIYEIVVNIDANCSLKSAKGAVVIRNIEKFAVVIDVHPSKEVIREKGPDRFRMILVSEHDADVIKDSVQYLSEISNVEMKHFNTDRINAESNPNPVEKFDITRENELISQIPPVSPAHSTSPLHSMSPVSPAPQIIQSIRIDINKLDSLMNRIGELVISRIGMEYIISNYDDTGLAESMEQFSKLLEELHVEVMQIRMVPIDFIFSKYPRMVRDMAKNNGKKVTLIIEGSDVELDRTILDGVNDPLVHILRNCVDHGIETPEQRIKVAKPEMGIVRIEARREKSNVIIEISDDGGGIIPEVIKEAAISSGLISEDKAAEMNDDELVSLIFLPGLSTARTITDISGRGVGMEIVKRDIERMGGTIKISSMPGKGCRFGMKLPLTLAVIKALLIRVGTHVFFFPFNNALETIRITNDQIRMLDTNETFILRDDVIPLFRLSKMLGIESTCSPDDEIDMIITEHENHLAGLLVDELKGQQEIVMKSLGPSLGRVKGFAGATIIENGNVVLILDIHSLW